EPPLPLGVMPPGDPPAPAPSRVGLRSEAVPQLTAAKRTKTRLRLDIMNHPLALSSIDDRAKIVRRKAYAAVPDLEAGEDVAEVPAGVDHAAHDAVVDEALQVEAHHGGGVAANVRDDGTPLLRADPEVPSPAGETDRPGAGSASADRLR